MNIVQTELQECQIKYVCVRRSVLYLSCVCISSSLHFVMCDSRLKRYKLQPISVVHSKTQRLVRSKS